MALEPADFQTGKPAANSAATQWIGYTTETAGSVDHLVADFRPRDYDAGRKAAKFLKEEALVNAGMTRTHLCISDTRLEGFISCCSGSVTLSERSIRSLGFRTEIKTMPAVLVTWVARHGDGVVPGCELLTTAYALAREATTTIAAVALVVDPADEQVAEVWKREPYNFQESDHGGRGRPKRLWTPLDPEPLEDEEGDYARSI